MCTEAMGEPTEEAHQNHNDGDIADGDIQDTQEEALSEPRKCEATATMCHEGGQMNGFRGEAGAPGGHDSGVEVAAGEYASSGAPDPLSRASSLISCGSGCDDSFDILSCKNADRLDDYKSGVAGDGTSEGGSESSSVTGGNSARSGVAASRKPATVAKKRVAVNDPARASKPKPTPAPRPTQGRAPNLATRERARSRDKASSMEKPPPPPGPKPTILPRSRLRNTPDSLNLNCREPPIFKVKATKTSTARCRTPGTPPEEPRSIKFPGPSPCASTPRAPPLESPFGNRSRMTPDSKAAFDKYATLPRRKRESSPELAALRREARSTSANRDTSMNRSMTALRRNVTRDRESPPLRSLPPYPKHKSAGRIRIYHEISMQTVLVGSDVENALAGIGITEVRTDLIPVEKVDRGIQVDNRDAEIERLEQRVRLLLEANANLQMHSDMQTEKLELTEARLEEERAEKMTAQQELQRNTERVLGMLGGGCMGNGKGADSLMLLESQLQTSANIVTKQQDEINKLHSACREMQKELESSHRAQRTLETHLREAEREAGELQDFLQAEKGALAEALRDTENALSRAEAERTRARQDCRATLRLAEQRRQEALALRARLSAQARPPPGPPPRSRPSQRTPALPGLAQGLTTLLNALIAEHCISPEELEDVIFHNEAFSHSASSEGCSPASPPPHPPHPPSVNTKLACQLSEDENSADLLDSETEPCLMMENVLEDVQILDTYSHNLVSSTHSVVSCPPGVVGQTTSADPILIQPNENRFLNIFNKEDSCSSLQNLTTFSGDELSPVIPDEKFNPDMCYPNVEMTHLDYSENDSLHNLSQAILQRQRSEAECSMSEDYTGQREADASAKPPNYLVDQVILVDNLVNKLLKVLKIIHSKEGPAEPPQTVEEQASEEMIVNDIASKMAQLCVSNLPHDAISENETDPLTEDSQLEVLASANTKGTPTFISGFFTKFFHKS